MGAFRVIIRNPNMQCSGVFVQGITTHCIPNQLFAPI